MTTISVQAVYQNGSLKPSARLNLLEGATVAIEISYTPPPAAAEISPFASLKGILAHLSDQDLDQVEQNLTRLRQQTAGKTEWLARQLTNDLNGRHA